MTFVIVESVKMAFVRTAELKLTPVRFVSVKSVPVSVAAPKLAFVRFEPVNFTPEALALYQEESTSDLFIKSLVTLVAS